MRPSGAQLTLRTIVLAVIALLGLPEIALATGDIEVAGDVLQVLIPVLGIGTTVFYEDGHAGTVQFVESFAAAQLTTVVLKEAIHKKRPNGQCCSSFPSGHTSAAFMGASFIHRRYGWKYAWPAYLGATFVAYSRVEADKHFVEDVAAGAAIGIASSFLFTHPYHGVEISATADGGAYGLQFRKRFR